MSTADMIKNSVLDKFQTGNLTTTSIIITIGMAIFMGMFIYGVYRMNTHSGFYQRGFNKSLAILPVITSAIILAMGSNLTISLGMVGALSIVRFRNAVKDPVDLTYLFWSISTGIVVGAGLFELAILLSIAIAVLITFLDMIPTFRAPCLMVVSGKEVAIEDMLNKYAKAHSKHMKVRSRNISGKGVEWIFEMQITDEKKLIEKIASIEGVTSVCLMTHDGEIRL